MDSSGYKMEEETEEFSSNESGWTKYIASPGPEHNFSSDVDDANGDEVWGRMDAHGNDNDDEDDHDSIASDASSGPAHCVLSGHEVGAIEGEYAVRHEDQDQDEDSCNFYSAGKMGYYKEVKERGGKMTNGKARFNEAIPIRTPSRATSYNGVKKMQGKTNKQGDK